MRLKNHQQISTVNALKCSPNKMAFQQDGRVNVLLLKPKKVGLKVMKDEAT